MRFTTMPAFEQVNGTLFFVLNCFPAIGRRLQCRWEQVKVASGGGVQY